MNVGNIEVIVDDVENNPHCIHGPSLLFKKFSGKIKEYYACSACRNHKDCNFYVPLNEKHSNSNSNNFWKEKQKEAVHAINKLNPYQTFLKILNFIKNQPNSITSGKITHKFGNKKVKKTHNKGSANYCYTCSCLFDSSETDNHHTCKIMCDLTCHQLTHPTEILIPKTDSKTHAQYFFSKTSVTDISLLLTRLKVTKILCIGTPRIHEHVINNYSNKIKSLLLDMDKNYYNFYSKSQFIWFNMFNNYIFDNEQKETLCKFLKSGRIAILMDPPFGGRVEPLSRTLNLLSKTFKDVNNGRGNSTLGTFWFFPYFMERYILESLPKFKMFDYKVNYENHSSFTDTGNRKRKFGSPVRIFTDVPLARLDLKGVYGYKFCKPCGYWVSNENKHCGECDACTSKNGKTYIHCPKCSKCVKASYKHCDTCKRCCLLSHVCGNFQPDFKCYHCHEPGHKKNECPLLEEKKKLLGDIPKKKRKIK